MPFVVPGPETETKRDEAQARDSWYSCVQPCLARSKAAAFKRADERGEYLWKANLLALSGTAAGITEATGLQPGSSKMC